MKKLTETTAIDAILNGPPVAHNAPTGGAIASTDGATPAATKMVFHRNRKIEFEGARYSVRHVPDAKPDAQIVLSGGGKTLTMSVDDFAKQYGGGHRNLINAARKTLKEVDAAIATLPSRPIASHPPAIQAEIRQRLFAMRHVDRLTTASGAAPTEKVFADAGVLALQDCVAQGIETGKGKPASAKKVRGLYPAWVASGRNPAALAPLHHLKGSKARKLKHPRLVTLMRVAIRRYYLVPERPTVAYVHALLKGMVASEVERGKLPSETKAPSYETFRNEIDRTIEKREWLASREGADAGRTLRITKPGIVAERPLQYVAVDHTRLDGFVLVEVRGRYYAVRPWLTAGIDIYTRSVWSAVLSLSPPSARTLAALLRFGAMPKDGATWGAVSPYAVWGIPEVIVSDGGGEFVSAFWRMTAALVGFEFRIVPRATLNGIIERFWGTVATNFCSGLPGRSFASVAERGAYEAGPNAALFLSEMHRDFMLWVVDVYHNRPRTALGGKTPIEAWREAVEDPDMQPYTVADVDDFLIAISQVKTCKITNKGVRVNGAFYTSDDAQRLFAKHGAGIDYEVRYEATDHSRIFLLDPDEHRWLTLTCMTPGTVVDLDRAEWLKTVKLEPETGNVQDVAAATQLKIAERRQKIVKAQKKGERPKTGDKVAASKKALPPVTKAASATARQNARKPVRPAEQTKRGPKAVKFNSNEG